MRSVFLLLILANLAFFAWDRGYFGKPQDGHEAHRLKAQINPDKIRIVSTAKTAAAEACRIVGNLRIADAQALQATLGQRLPNTKVTVAAVPQSTAYEVAISDLAGRAAADSKLADLAKLGIKDVRTVADDKGRFTLVLASYQNEAAAREYLQAHKGLRTAKVAARPGLADRMQLQIQGPQSSLARLPDLISGLDEATGADCPAP